MSLSYKKTLAKVFFCFLSFYSCESQAQVKIMTNDPAVATFISESFEELVDIKLLFSSQSEDLACNCQSEIDFVPEDAQIVVVRHINSHMLARYPDKVFITYGNYQSDAHEYSTISFYRLLSQEIFKEILKLTSDSMMRCRIYEKMMSLDDKLSLYSSLKRRLAYRIANKKILTDCLQGYYLLYSPALNDIWCEENIRLLKYMHDTDANTPMDIPVKSLRDINKDFFPEWILLSDEGENSVVRDYLENLAHNTNTKILFMKTPKSGVHYGGLQESIEQLEFLLEQIEPSSDDIMRIKTHNSSSKRFDYDTSLGVCTCHERK